MDKNMKIIHLEIIHFMMVVIIWMKTKSEPWNMIKTGIWKALNSIVVSKLGYVFLASGI